VVLGDDRVGHWGFPLGANMFTGSAPGVDQSEVRAPCALTFIGPKRVDFRAVH